MQVDHDVEIPVRFEPSDGAHETLELLGILSVPDGARGLVIFAHGSGSGRNSPRNRMVAAQLQARGFATLLFDLLTREEEQIDFVTAHLRFDIDRLAMRLVDATRWASARPTLAGLRTGFFGASTGAAAALVAAARLADEGLEVGAVVSRGGRPDLAGEALARVTAPTLLIVGGDDQAVLSLNQAAGRQLELARHRLTIVPGAGHLFTEPGALERVARLAGEWFEHYLPVEVGADADLHEQGAEPGRPPRTSPWAGDRPTAPRHASPTSRWEPRA
jgi:dienelactone hydrolase